MSNIQKHSQIFTFYHLNKLISVFKLKKYLQLDPTARNSIIIHFCLFIKMTPSNFLSQPNVTFALHLHVRPLTWPRFDQWDRSPIESCQTAHAQWAFAILVCWSIRWHVRCRLIINLHPSLSKQSEYLSNSVAILLISYCFTYTS